VTTMPLERVVAAVLSLAQASDPLTSPPAP
jgi:hypothetical protein